MFGMDAAKENIDVAIKLHPEIADRLSVTDLRKEIVGLGVRAIDPQADPVDAPGLHGVWRKANHPISQAHVEADAVHVVDCDLSVEEGGRVIHRDDLH